MVLPVVVANRRRLVGLPLAQVQPRAEPKVRPADLVVAVRKVSRRDRVDRPVALAVETARAVAVVLPTSIPMHRVRPQPL